MIDLKKFRVQSHKNQLSHTISMRPTSSVLLCFLLFTIGVNCDTFTVPDHPLLGGVSYPPFNTSSPIDVTWFNYCNASQTPSKTCGGSGSGCYEISYPVSLQMTYDNATLSYSGVYVSADILRIDVMIAGEVVGNDGLNPTKTLSTSDFQNRLNDLKNVQDLSTLGGRAVGTISGLGDMNRIVGWHFSYFTPDYEYQLEIETLSWSIYQLHSASPRKDLIASGNFFECSFLNPGRSCISSSCATL